MNSRSDLTELSMQMWVQTAESVRCDFQARIERFKIPNLSMAEFENNVCNIFMTTAMYHASFLDKVYGKNSSKVFIEIVKDSVSEIRKGENPIIQRVIRTAYEKAINSVNRKSLKTISIRRFHQSNHKTQQTND